MFICETEFEQPDPKDPDYSLVEIDYYSHIPYGSNFPQHRLTLRRNMRTGEYEIIRVYHEKQVEVAFKSKIFRKVLEWANGEVRRFWGQDREPDKPCEHKPPNLYHGCRIWAKTPYEEKMKIYKELAKAKEKEGS